MQVGIPELKKCLLLEPAMADEQAIDHTSFVFLSACFQRRAHDIARDNRRVGLCDLEFFDLAGNHFLDQVFETEGDFRDFHGREGGRDSIAAVCGWKD